MDQQFSLRWNNYLNQITDAFGSLRYDEDLVDVTLSCEGKRLKAHRMLLSACSSYFRDVFKENPCQHPVIVFKNVKYTDLAAIVDFMYKGEVQVVQDQLESFLGTAELLEVKGLTEGSAKSGPEEEETNVGSAEVAKRYDARNQNTPPATHIPASSRASSPSVKKRKYGAPAKTAMKSTTEIHPFVPKMEKEEITNDVIFEDDNEHHLSNADPLQDALGESNTTEFNANSNVSQDPLGQRPIAEPRTSLEGAPQEAMQVEDLDTIKLDSLIGNKDKNELVINKTMEFEDDGMKGMDEVNEDSTSNNNLCEGISEELLEHSTTAPEMTIPRSENEKDFETTTVAKPLLIEKGAVKLPRGLTVTVSPAAKGFKNQSDVKQRDEDVIALRSEEAKTPAQEDHLSCQSNDTQETYPEATIATDQIQPIEPEMASEAPEDEMSCVPEVEPSEPEFDYYGCETCKADKKPFENKFIFSHKCPICPCSCFCAHLLKEHMKYIHGWFNVQRRFTQF